MALGGYISSICFHRIGIIVSLNSVSYAPVLRVFFAFPSVVLVLLIASFKDRQEFCVVCRLAKCPHDSGAKEEADEIVEVQT